MNVAHLPIEIDELTLNRLISARLKDIYRAIIG